MALQQQLLNEIFEYKDGELYFKKNTRRNPAGKKAGSVKGRYKVVNSRQIQNPSTTQKHHRIVWVMHHGDIVGGQEVDHIDGDTFNNRIENLRCVSHKQNMRNQKKYKTNTSGSTGIAKAESGRWKASIRNGKLIHLGTYTSKTDAMQARAIAEIILGYDKNHGKDRHAQHC